MKQLIAYLLDNMILDFQGDLTLDMVRDFLRDDESREARALLAKLVEDRGVSDMMITLADCLQDAIKTGISEEVVREQIRTYAESSISTRRPLRPAPAPAPAPPPPAVSTNTWVFDGICASFGITTMPSMTVKWRRSSRS